MAISATNLTSGHDNDGNSTASSASITPTSNYLVLLSVYSYYNDGGAGTNPNIPTVTGNSLTWSQVTTKVYDDTGSSRRRVTVFQALGASPSAGAVSMDFSAQNQGNVAWIIDQFSSVDTTTPVVQSASNYLPPGSPGTSLTVTLAAFGSTNNATYGTFASSNDSSTITQGTGFTKLATQDFGTGALNASLITQFRSDNDTTVDATFASQDQLGGIGIEIAAATTSTRYHHLLTLGAG